MTHPTKPIGPYYAEAEARRLESGLGYHMAAAGAAADSWRRMVPSPRPCAIEYADEIIQLARSGVIVVACGGGGVPVVEVGSSLVGVEAVVDKDLASCILAKAVQLTHC